MGKHPFLTFVIGVVLVYTGDAVMHSEVFKFIDWFVRWVIGLIIFVIGSAVTVVKGLDVLIEFYKKHFK